MSDTPMLDAVNAVLPVPMSRLAAVWMAAEVLASEPGATPEGAERAIWFWVSAEMEHKRQCQDTTQPSTSTSKPESTPSGVSTTTAQL